MALFPYPDLESLSAPARQIVEAMPLNLVRMLAGLGPAFPSLLGLMKAVGEIGGLTAQQRELIALRVAHRTNACYVWTQHEAIARELGLGDDDIDATRVTTSPSVLLVLIDALINGPADAASVEAVREAHGDNAVHEAILVTGLYLFLGRYSETLQVELDPVMLDDMTGRLSQN